MSFFVLVVFVVDDFFTVATFLVMVAAFFVGSSVVEAIFADLVLLTGAFFAGAAFVFSFAFFVVVLFFEG